MQIPLRRFIGWISGLLILLSFGGYLVYSHWGRHEVLPEGLIQANGRIEGDRVIVASKFSGRIQKLFVKEGDIVTAGQLLAQLDDAQTRARVEQASEAASTLEAQIGSAITSLTVSKKEVPLAVESAEAGFASARSAVARAEAAEKQAQRDAERYRELSEKGFAEKTKSEQADLAWTNAKNELAGAQNSLVQSEKQLSQARLGWERVKAKEDELRALKKQLNQARAALKEAESVLSDLTIQAPSPGVVTTRIRDAGEVITPGGPIFELVDLDRLYLKVYVPEVEIGKLRLGLPARIYIDAFPDRYFTATVRYISSRAEFTPKEVQTPDERVKLIYAVKLYLDENPERRLTPGLPADAVIRWKEGTPWVKPRW